MTDRRSPVACTVVSRAALPSARVLARSYLEHHPGGEFVVVTTDGVPEDVQPIPGCRVVGPEFLDLDRTTFLRMATSYTAAELASAVRPFLLRALLAESDVVLYLGPDTWVLAPLGHVAELAEEHGIVLAPKLLEPLPRDGREPDEASVVLAGLFDLACLAVGRSAKPFLDFWGERSRQDGATSGGVGARACDHWVDQVPSLFRHAVLRDRGIAAAYWNLHERPLLRAAAGRLYAGDERLRLLHLAG